MTPIEIECPVRGTWAFLNPPGHHPDAKDFVAVDERGKPYALAGLVSHLLWKLKASNTFAWEKGVFAPFDAVIVEAEHTCDDRTTLNLVRDAIAGLILARRHDMSDKQFFLGNHVIARSDSGVYALFAHLRKDSLRVHKGARVKSGDPIAAIGNSGNTIQPHLHFQLMSENEPLTAPPLPFVFSAYETRLGNTWRQERSSLPRNSQVFRTKVAA